jgi:hypothetical protein
MQTLLDRMDTNPEEFSHTNRWLPIYKKFEMYLTEEEKEGWAKKLREVHRKAFGDAVMKELLMAEGENEIERAIRPSVAVGTLRYNTNTMQTEVFDGSTWINAPTNTASVFAGGGGKGTGVGNGVGGGGGGSGMLIVNTPTETITYTGSGSWSNPKP